MNTQQKKGIYRKEQLCKSVNGSLGESWIESTTLWGDQMILIQLL